MNKISILKQSIIALKLNKLRSFFSILGIVIGVASVVIILSVGQGLKGFVTNEIEAFGPNILDIAIKVPGDNQMGTIVSVAKGIKITTLKTDDIKALKNKQRFPYIEAVYGQAFGQDWVAYKNNEKRTIFYGASADFPLVIKTAKIDKGRFYTDSEEKSLARVVVLGNNLANHFFKKNNPLEKKIKIKGQNYEIIGVLKPMGGIAMGGIDMNDFLYIPLETALKQILGINYLTEIALTIKDETYSARAIKEISRMLRQNHNIIDPSKDDFQITTMEEILNQINEISYVLNLLLGFLAAISLLVGGVGIMNIMLVNVTERTKEIGLRKSLGASSRDILGQFLIEGLIITGVGGLIGTLTGILFSFLIGFGAQQQGLTWPLTISWLAVSIAFLIAVIIGLVFGIYPAKKAAKLNPIKALKHE
ncbi:ABC transporter permease [Patescibacteria group bacterium]|nr:ABC transporter permease [Patescibacteria group bacterium]